MPCFSHQIHGTRSALTSHFYFTFGNRLGNLGLLVFHRVYPITLMPATRDHLRTLSIGLYKVNQVTTRILE